MIERLWNYLTSTRFTIALFGILSVMSILGTFPGMDALYRLPVFRIMVGLLGVCTLSCTLRRWRTVTWPVLVIHSGVIVTLIGGMLSWLGYVATVNTYEDVAVENFFRWDIEKDVPLGFALIVKRINFDYYPVQVKVGVMKGVEKKELFMLKTGESFVLDGYDIRADRLEPTLEKLDLTISNKGKVIGTADTEGFSELPPDFPYSFKLVAYQNPILKRMWVDLRLESNGQAVAEGTSEVNAPMHWNGLSFYNTKVAVEPSGKKYAGIQIVKDPGRPVVFAGMIITSLGGVLAFARRKVWS